MPSSKKIPKTDTNTPQAFEDHTALLSAIDRAIRVSETRYRRLFETAQDGILLLNAETAQIEDVNPFLIDMLGYSREEFMGKKLWEVGAFKDIKASKDAFLKLQKTKNRD